MFDLPQHYSSSPYICSLQNAFEISFNNIQTDVDIFEQQFFIETATYGLIYFESMLGLNTNLLLDIDIRRSLIKTKLRGIGVTTLTQIQNLCSSYGMSDVEITENFEQYSIIIKFTGFIGVPPNSDSLKAALLELIPCHLALEFKFVFNTWKDIEDINLTWTEAMSLGLTWEDLETFTR